MTLRKHVNANHVVIAKNMEEKINRHVKGVLEKQPTKTNVFNSAISKKARCKYPFKKNDVQHINSCKTLAF